MSDENKTQPVNSRTSGPLSDSGLRAIDRTPQVIIESTEPRPYTNLPTRILYHPVDAFNKAKGILEAAKKDALLRARPDGNERQQERLMQAIKGVPQSFEMYLDLVDTLGPYDRLHFVARFRKNGYEGYIQTRRGFLVMVGDRCLADAWEKLKHHFPQTLEASALWCFSEFTNWNNEAWIKYWREKQTQIRMGRRS